MPRPRRSLVCKSDTPYYHCVSRCVRRAHLCGQDKATGTCYEHRRQWIVERIHLLASLFAIDVCAYAIMSNHYHVVLKLNTAEEWTNEEVISRWLMLFQGPVLARRFHAGEQLTSIQHQTVADIAKVWRDRLQDLSWFMKCLNEPIARQANAEDDCTGHFWEARFKSQALRTDQALLSCLAYVDLNPIRANMAETPEASNYTSLQQRLSKPVNQQIQAGLRKAYPALPAQVSIKPLLHFESAIHETIKTGIPFSFTDYLQLVDWTGRQIHPGKRGALASDLPPILRRLAIEADQWLISSRKFELIYYQRFGRAA